MRLGLGLGRRGKFFPRQRTQLGISPGLLDFFFLQAPKSEPQWNPRETRAERQAGRQAGIGCQLIPACCVVPSTWHTSSPMVSVGTEVHVKYHVTLHSVDDCASLIKSLYHKSPLPEKFCLGCLR